MTTFSTHLRRILVSIVAAVAMLLGLTVAAQPAAATSFTTTQLSSIARSVLSLMNQERQNHGVAPLSMSGRLILAAHRHNQWMARANTMSHYISGEPTLGQRITKTGYIWRACAENIGWNSVASLSGMLYLQRVMYNELPPNDGHKRNILNPVYRNVGIDVYYDATHRKMWLTEDFGRLAGT